MLKVVWTRQKIASYGVGPKKMSEHYAYISPQRTHVNLGFYHGVALADRSGLLEGTGKNLRHIKIKSATEAKSARIKELLVEAIAERESVTCPHERVHLLS